MYNILCVRDRPVTQWKGFVSFSEKSHNRVEQADFRDITSIRGVPPLISKSFCKLVSAHLQVQIQNLSRPTADLSLILLISIHISGVLNITSDKVR